MSLRGMEFHTEGPPQAILKSADSSVSLENDKGIVEGLPVMAKKGRVTCSMKEKPGVEDGSLKMGMGASLMAAACAATMSSPAMALVDERMSTEGTGLPFGLSNNTLGWILFGVFGLIWALYFVYTATLEEDEESGLSL